MDELLTPVSTTYRRSSTLSEPLLQEVKTSKISTSPSPSHSKPHAAPKSLDDVLETLKSQPDYEDLIAALRYLAGDGQAYRLTVGPKSAAIVQVLVSDIALNYWVMLRGSALASNEERTSTEPMEANDDTEFFMRCLRNLTALNALVGQLNSMLSEARSESVDAKGPGVNPNISIPVTILSSLLQGETTIRDLWENSVSGVQNQIQVKAQRQQLVSLLSGGRIQNLTAEASMLLDNSGAKVMPWVCNGSQYSDWIAKNLVFWVREADEGAREMLASLFQRSLSLGYPDKLMRATADLLLFSSEQRTDLFKTLCLQNQSTTRKIINYVLKHLAETHLNLLCLSNAEPNATVSAAAGLLHSIVGTDSSKREILQDWACSTSGAGLGDGIGIRRAVVSAIAQDRDQATTLFERSLANFGDELYIKHTPVLQQEVHTQVLLLSAGYLQRLSPLKLTMLLRSATYLRTISNRIAAMQSRTRFLGMVVGETLSTLVHDNKQKLDFHMEGAEAEDALWLKSLVTVSDAIGSPGELASQTPASKDRVQARTPTKPKKAAKKEPKVPTMPPRGIIEEIDSSEDDDDLQPYAKGPDPEDSDEDPTLIERNKARPPVYIRTLIEYFRDSESYDKQRLALETAPSLIRRKANYGTELSSHADELASLLAGIQDKYELETFHDLRLQGMIALIVAQPKAMAPWFARTFFEGDYSLTQRTSVLVAIGLAARELAGFQTSEYKDASLFPSKQLPAKIEQLYLSDDSSMKKQQTPSELKSLPPTALHQIADSLTSSFLAPMAAEAADANTGPDALKLETFTARYKSKTKTKPRVRAIANTTAGLLASSFFSPLTAHFMVALRSSKPLILNPSLLSLYLQTLGVVIHAAGPSTLSLPQLTSELWDLLLAVRIHALEDLSATRGWLIALASMLEVNESDMRRLCEAQGKEILETREWVGAIFERIRGDDGGEENEVKMLAAGVLIRLGEAVEKQQALLMGDMIGFS